MKRYEITTKIEHIEDESEGRVSRLVMFANGERINFINFGYWHPTQADVERARWSLANQLYWNKNYAQYHDALYHLVYPFGE